MTTHALRVRRISRNVHDLPRAVAFYRDALQFEPLQQRRWPGMACGAQAARLRLGAQEVELVAFDTHGLPYPSHHGASDPWFQHLAIVVADMSAAYAQLCRHAFEPISEGGPQTLPPHTGSVTAFKFRDPDGHPLELIHFPAGRGDARWQRGNALFRGIDHTAMVVTDLEKSLDFYATLGFHRTSRSHNHGAAQERLDAIAHVEVEVVGLTASEDQPPRLELLAYRAPTGNVGGMAPDDDAVDRTVVEVEHLAQLMDALKLHGDCRDGVALARDPDGHRLLLHEKT